MESKYLKYKYKYLLLLNKLNGGALTVPTNEIKIFDFSNTELFSLHNITKNDEKYSSQDIIDQLKERRINGKPFKILTRSGILIFCHLYPIDLDPYIDIEYNELSLVVLDINQEALFDQDALYRNLNVRDIVKSNNHYSKLDDIFRKYPELILNENYLLYLLNVATQLTDILPSFFSDAVAIALIVNPVVGNNKTFWPFIVKYDHKLFTYASQELKSDNDFMKEMIKLDNRLLEYASDQIKDDENFIKPIILEYPELFDKISEKVIRKIVSKLPRDLIIHLINVNGMILKYGSPDMKRDKSIVELALNQNLEAFEFIDSSFKLDKNFVKNLLIKAIKDININPFKVNKIGYILDDSIKTDLDFIINLIKDCDFNPKSKSQRHKLGYVLDSMSRIVKDRSVYKIIYKNLEDQSRASIINKTCIE
jgi:hypothetical protein